MKKRVNIRLIATIILSLVDEAIIVALIIIGLSWLGIDVPLWAIIILALAFLAVTYPIYRVLRKSPQLGFENMIGQKGVSVEPIAGKGTVKIKGELWAAATDGEKIETGAEVIVTGQTGLKLKVTRTPGDKRNPG